MLSTDGVSLSPTPRLHPFLFLHPSLSLCRLHLLGFFANLISFQSLFEDERGEEIHGFRSGEAVYRRDYFRKYGDVMQTVVMRDKDTGKSRGFGFVIFAESALGGGAVLATRICCGGGSTDGASVEEEPAGAEVEELAVLGMTFYRRTVRCSQVYLGGIVVVAQETPLRRILPMLD